MSTRRPVSSGPVARLAARVGGVALVMSSVVLTSLPAYAGEHPVGWEDPGSIDPIHALLIFLIGPIGLTLIIVALTAAPWFIRGEGLGSNPEKTNPEKTLAGRGSEPELAVSEKDA